MTRTALASMPAVDGTAALAPQRRRPSLTLIEGGRRSPRQRAAARGDLTSRQLLLVSLVGAFVIAALALSSLLSDALARRAVTEALEAAPVESVVVHEGDTLWGIAEERAVAGVSTGDLVSWISAENGLSTGLVAAGQTLVVPVSS